MINYTFIRIFTYILFHKIITEFDYSNSCLIHTINLY